MFFRKKKQQLMDDDARAYVNFFEESTTSIFMTLGMQARQSGHKDALGDDGLLFDAVEVWHQAIAREQLMTLAPVFYGDEEVEKQISGLLNDYERERLDKFREGVTIDEFTAQIEAATAELLNSESNSRYADLLIGQLPQLEGIIGKPVLEQTAEDLRVHTLAFWRKNGYC